LTRNLSDYPKRRGSNALSRAVFIKLVRSIFGGDGASVFFFGADVEKYLKQLWSDIVDVGAADTELPAVNDLEARRKLLERRRVALERIGRFEREGQPLFARYKRPPKAFFEYQKFACSRELPRYKFMAPSR
jgi:hypothetical protein